MAAGLGFKTFNTGDVLSASDVNGYLMQGVLVFADATARDAAITSPQEGQFAYTKNNDSLWYYSGSAWVASGATGDIEGVTAGTGISGGGTSGTVTITNSMATAIDAKGDLVVGTGADTFSRLAVGTNDYVLTADSTQATGLKWAAAASGSSFVGCRATGSTNQTISNTTQTTLNWNTETFDTDGFHSTSSNTSRMTIPSGKAGYYRVDAILGWSPDNTSGHRVLYIFKNADATAYQYFTNTGANYAMDIITTVINLSVGDYLELKCYQASGGDLDTNHSVSQFCLTYLGA